jgi:hypothetical protein
MRLFRILGVAVLAGLLAAAGAQAAVLEVRFDGVVASGFDQTGTFGLAGADLAGASFSASYLFSDAPTPFAFVTSTYNPPLDSSFQYILPGGGDPNRPIVTIAINGVTVLVGCQSAFDACGFNLHNSAGAGGLWGVTAAETNFAVDSVTPATFNRDLSLGITSTTDHFVTNYDYHTPLTHTFQPGDVATGSLTLSNHVLAGIFPDHYNENVTATLTPQSVTISSPAAVPEPAAWLLMISGFGAIGAALRRRRGDDLKRQALRKTSIRLLAGMPMRSSRFNR